MMTILHRYVSCVGSCLAHLNPAVQLPPDGQALANTIAVNFESLEEAARVVNIRTSLQTAALFLTPQDGPQTVLAEYWADALGWCRNTQGGNYRGDLGNLQVAWSASTKRALLVKLSAPTYCLDRVWLCGFFGLCSRRLQVSPASIGWHVEVADGQGCVEGVQIGRLGGYGFATAVGRN